MAATLNISFGGKRKISASPLTLVYYDEEFSTDKQEADLLADFMTIINGMNSVRRSINGIKMMRIVWALEKTYKNGQIEPFVIWVKTLPSVDFTNPELVEQLSDVVMSEFFRSNETEQEPNEVKD